MIKQKAQLWVGYQLLLEFYLFTRQKNHVYAASRRHPQIKTYTFINVIVSIC